MLADRIDEVAALLRQAGHGCWFLQDFHGQNSIAVRMLGLDPDALATRRASVAIHADGTVRTLSHRIETATLEHWPGERHVYSSYDEYAAGVAALIDGAGSVCCEYSANGQNPYLSMLDGGTVDLLRREGELVESGWLVQHFEARLTTEQVAQYERSVEITSEAFRLVESHLRDHLDTGTTEAAVMKVILDHFERLNFDPDHPPIVGVGPNSGQPHYETGTGSQTTIGRDAVVLVDLWGKVREPGAVFSDFTRMFYTGPTPPPKVAEVFGVAAAARDAAIDLIEGRADGTIAGGLVAGKEPDQLARAIISEAGYGEAFTHRLGHSITTQLHGSGAHLDGFEIIENRKLVPGLLFSVEPGIYLPEFGVRTEVNVRIDDNGTPHVYAAGDIQRAITCVHN